MPARGKLKYEPKLTWDRVNAIRRQYRWHSREAGGAALAKKYGVSTNTIHKIIHGRIWRVSVGDGNTALPSVQRTNGKALSLAYRQIDEHLKALTSLGCKITP